MFFLPVFYSSISGLGFSHVLLGGFMLVVNAVPQATACVVMLIIDIVFAVSMHHMHRGHVRGGALPFSDARTIDTWASTRMAPGRGGWDQAFDPQRYTQPHLRRGVVRPNE